MNVSKVYSQYLIIFLIMFIVAGKDLSDPNSDIRFNECYQWYCEIFNKLQKVQSENKKIQNDIFRR